MVFISELVSKPTENDWISLEKRHAIVDLVGLRYFAAREEPNSTETSDETQIQGRIHDLSGG